MGCDAREAWGHRARAILDALAFSPRSVLDFGAGAGHFVNALREAGIAAEGIETSPSGRAAARRMYHLELHAELPVNRFREFQLVTLIHSLEHVADPVRTLAELGAAMATDGTLFIEVPHAGSFDTWWPSRRREILDLPVHLYHFVPATLARVVDRAGFRVVDLRLFNSAVVEWALTKKARWRNSGRDHRSGSASGQCSSSSPRASGSAPSVWAARVLPWIRQHFPGGKLQMLASRAS